MRFSFIVLAILAAVAGYNAPDLVRGLAAQSATAPRIVQLVDQNGWTPDQVQDSVRFWSDYFGVQSEWMLEVVYCETGGSYRTDIVGKAGEIGPAQWLRATFAAYAPEPFLSNGVDNPDTNIAAMVWAHSQGFGWLWTCG